MKFLINTLSKCGPRLGTLKDFNSNPESIMETPMPMLYTRGGSLPHITYEVFKIICNTPQILQIPLTTTYHFQDVLDRYDGNVTDFVGFKDVISCVTVQDPGDLTQSGHHCKDNIPIWTRSGKVMINAESYMDVIEAFKPDMYYFLSDGDTNAKSPSKRISKAVDSTISYFHSCLKRHKNSDVLKNSFPMAAVAGGYCNIARRKCIDAVAKDDNTMGILIDGLHNNGPEVEFVPFDEVKSIVELVVKNIPEHKLRVVQGCWNPTVIIKMVKLGIDIFDTSYCNLVTERSSALIFSYNLDTYDDRDLYEMNLRQLRFAGDFKPLSATCGCMTCSKYSRAYIHHLVRVQELLGPILLTIHNNYHFLKFFESIRLSINNGTIDDLEKIVENQFNKHKELSMKPSKEENRRPSFPSLNIVAN